MKAKKCDRCGEFYILESDCSVSFINKTISGFSKTMDLCPDCYEELIRYLTNSNSIVCNVNGGNENEK